MIVQRRAQTEETLLRKQRTRKHSNLDRFVPTPSISDTVFIIFSANKCESRTTLRTQENNNVISFKPQLDDTSTKVPASGHQHSFHPISFQGRKCKFPRISFQGRKYNLFPISNHVVFVVNPAARYLGADEVVGVGAFARRLPHSNQ